ncbi:hypothetical protein OUZ56_002594 [Daphnia magna]|uniref:Uncharacterized protein n=1 Tax=Daphnia magna TaxID=35525 RepID=A0ABR0A660_9CRUS|nr:hypothetical protein OUZ56_002594 [Daphnia magna]
MSLLIGTPYTQYNQLLVGRFEKEQPFCGCLKVKKISLIVLSHYLNFCQNRLRTFTGHKPRMSLP